MSSRPTKLTAALIAVTAGAGALAAAPLLAQDDGARGGRDGHHHGQPGPRAPQFGQPGGQPGSQPGAQPGAAPVMGVILPDQPGQQGPRTQGPRTQGLPGGVDDTSPRVAGADPWVPEGVRRGRSFRVSCDYVKSGMFDPIVFPGQEPAGHDHQFFGATTITKDSTPATLVAANLNRDATSCRRAADGSAYWMPALQLADDPAKPVAIEPDEIRVRYSAARRSRVRPFPVGFTLVAGDKSATAVQANAGWRCEYDAPGTPLQAAPPQCDADEAIVGVVRFPDCWDGLNATSTTQSHMAYRVAGACPADHPVAVPEITEEVFWPSDGQAHSYSLSSGNTAGLHADFMNGWDQRALRNQVRRWLNRRG